MRQYHGYSKTTNKGTGGKRKKAHDKKLRLVGRPPVATKVAEKRVVECLAGRGGNFKVKLKRESSANVLTPSGMKKAKIRNVVETPDNRHHARQNIITKGAIIDTELGKVKVTNRVGQDGVVNGILLQK
ncbi:30S ribosomal protein S8e [Candidatus Micrarchaeota archaeon CG11_big_fil_rev_8_21_14_0_20_47_5]|nr:MAG: hypothetical protein AUJ17_03955 [Candidatus Micrarchaeota archaeon CG1_02_47_40]PIN84097.1 MAG: 30S ribosomal protein S8e [Candidatus Micrarchaeota archaeon CG11_big_fil_rev_8_21_14_0_20_47_5]